MTKLQRICLLWAIFNLLILSTACGWVGQAATIINLLIPAINAALALLVAFGAGISPEAAAQVSKWGQEAVATLTNVVNPLLDEIKAATDAAKPALLDKLQAAVQAIANDLTNILPEIHVTNPQTQAKIVAIFQLILAQLVALVNVVPALQGRVNHVKAARLVHAVQEPGEFKESFNKLTAEYGPQFTI